jgi:hypothetical protein
MFQCSQCARNRFKIHNSMCVKIPSQVICLKCEVNTFKFWEQTEVSLSQVWRICRWSMAGMTFLAKNCNTQSKECAGALPCRRMYVSSFHNSLLVSHNINKYFQHLHVERLLNTGPVEDKFRVDVTLDLWNEINIVLILDFDSCGFFGLRELSTL